MTTPEGPTGDDQHRFPESMEEQGEAAIPPYEEGVLTESVLDSEANRVRLEDLSLTELVGYWRNQAATFESEAYTDEMTGRPNRRALIRQLEQDIAVNPGHVAIFFVDIDGLKRVNDTEGHAAGDVLISSALAILDQNLRLNRVGPDMIARGAFRLSGDESVGLLPNIQDEAQLAIIKDRLEHALAQQGIPAAIGYKLHKRGKSALELLAAADAQMYLIKDARREAKKSEELATWDDRQRRTSRHVVALLASVGLSVDDLYRVYGTGR